MDKLKNLAETWLLVEVVGRIVGMVALIAFVAIVGIKLWRDR